MSLLQPSSNSQLASSEKNAAPCSSKRTACFPRQNKCNTLKQSKHSTLAESEQDVFLQHSVRLINADPDLLTWEVLRGLSMLPCRKTGAARESQYSQIHTNTKPCIFFHDQWMRGEFCAELINSELVPLQLLVTAIGGGLGGISFTF